MRNNLSETYADFSASYNQPVISTRKNLVIWKGSTMAVGQQKLPLSIYHSKPAGPMSMVRTIDPSVSWFESLRDENRPRPGKLCPLFWSYMGINLGQSCPQMRPSWGQVAPSRSQVGLKLEPSGSKLGRSWSLAANVAAMSDRNGAFGRFWADLQDVQITRVPWAQPSLAAVRFDHLRQYDFNHLRQ